MTPAQARALLAADDRAAVLEGGFYEFVRLAWHYCKAGEPAFRPNWHLEEICVHCEAVTPPWRDDGTRGYDPENKSPWARPLVRELCVNIPPACTKSKILSVLWQAWVWTWRPDFRWLCVSYSDGVANELAEQCLRLIQSEWYRERWPHVRLDMRAGKAAVGFFKLTAGGGRLTTTVGGQLTGFHGHAMVIDDIVKPSEVNADAADSVACDAAWAWLQNTTPSRGLDAGTFARVLVGQCVRAADPYERFVEAGAMRLFFPMLAEPDHSCYTPYGGDRRTTEGETISDRFSPETVEKIARDSGGKDSAFFAAQYQQRSLPPGGLIFKKEYFQTFPLAQHPSAATHLALVIDANFKDAETSSDIGVAVVGAKLPWIGVYAGASERGGLIRAIELIGQYVATWRPSVILIEDKANGSAIIELLKKKFANIVAVPAKESKEARAWAASVPYKARSVWHEATCAAWVEGQLAAFPKGRKKDFVDALAHGIIYLTARDHTAFAEAMRAWTPAVERALGISE